MSLRPRPAGAFVLEDRETWDDNASIVDAWRLPSIPLAELDLNRAGAVIRKPRSHAAFKGRKEVLDHFHAGFDWQGGDAGTSRWVPQGLTGSADSSDADVDGRRWLAVSWHNEHDDVEHGMRMSFADVTEWATPIRYRHVLLVKPEPADDPSARATFSAIPAHAGGVVWFRNYLYVTDSRGFDSARPGGLLVFDMRQIKEVDDSRSDAIGWSQADEAYYAFGYRYVLPQVGQYVQKITDKERPCAGR